MVFIRFLEDFGIIFFNLFTVITVSRTITVGTLKMMLNSMPARPPMISTSRPLLTMPGKHPFPEFE